MGVAIAIETPLQDDVRDLVAELNAYLRPLSPPQFQFQMTVEQMADAKTTLFVARDATGRAVGMGALKLETAGLAEVKRMFTRPEVRGQRVGSALLAAVEALARQKGVTELKLETGVGEGFVPAHRVYERGGFTPCGAFLDYPDSGHSAFFAKRLR
ncbi:MAG: GNAT family N-acetyltransferase [Devosia sp.]|uniref:GNAT family N-acetyltransferase n=1 Tax=Devosia sp. 66-22 TaxID=1895753 RepID=UPI00092B0538|nr:GNAT family N-acetyltransferase [Devosia sp. 66-22]MBN9346317.1 GNAT family N-acetyltransferase [Devosia sp.]OJX53874.1 MAG: GNAT family N-acetyltransferase [Devosia sp. 66-22]